MDKKRNGGEEKEGNGEIKGKMRRGEEGMISTGE